MAFTEVYVDPSIAADSGTGTSGDPYGDLEYALAQTTHSGSPIRFNIKAGTAEVLSATLNPKATITTTQDNFCMFEGYTSTAGDGGQGEIEGTTNSVSVLTSANDPEFIAFKNLKISGGSTGYVIEQVKYGAVANCEIISANGGGLSCVNGYSIWIGNKISYGGTSSIGLECNSSGRMQMAFNYVLSTASDTSHGIFIGSGAVTFNIIDVSATTGASTNGIDVIQGRTPIINNTIIGGSGASCYGIDWNTEIPCAAINNYIEGFTGSSSYAMPEPTQQGLLLLNNKYYNCTNGFPSNNTFCHWNENNGVTTASGLLNLATNDFTPTDELRGLGWPSSWNNLSGNASYIDIGAVQVPSA